MTLIRKFIKAFTIIFLTIFILLTLFLNYKLYYTPSLTQVEGIVVNSDLIKQLHYLKKEMHNGAAEKMQQYYPEGFVFTQAVYGLSWSALADILPHKASLYKEALIEIDWCYENIQSRKGKGLFTENLSIPYGAYYTGWRYYLLGRKLLAQDITVRDSLEINDFNTACKEINDNISATVYPESYPGNSWPADVFVAVVCLSLHDKLFKAAYQQSIHNWLLKVKSHLDKNGFIPYAAAKDGTPKENARGSSESLILVFLHDLDTGFAGTQFKLYQQQFIDYRFGLPGIREFPKGTLSSGDVDSGPVILGIGSASTITGLKVLTEYRDSIHAVALRNSLEAFGFAFENKNEKKYLFGAWPMADVFLAWAHSDEVQQNGMLHTSLKWRTGFQIYGLIFLIVSIAAIWLLVRRNKTI